MNFSSKQEKTRQVQFYGGFNDLLKSQNIFRIYTHSRAFSQKETSSCVLHFLQKSVTQVTLKCCKHVYNQIETLSMNVDTSCPAALHSTHSVTNIKRMNRHLRKQPHTQEPKQECVSSSCFRLPHSPQVVSGEFQQLDLVGAHLVHSSMPLGHTAASHDRPPSHCFPGALNS